jgi:hypothetical protein
LIKDEPKSPEYACISTTSHSPIAKLGTRSAGVPPLCDVLFLFENQAWCMDGGLITGFFSKSLMNLTKMGKTLTQSRKLELRKT